jgi:hypothetical protein
MKSGSSLSVSGTVEIRGGDAGGGPESVGGNATVDLVDAHLSTGADLIVLGGNRNSSDPGGNALLKVGGNASALDVAGNIAVSSGMGGTATLEALNTNIRADGDVDIGAPAGEGESKIDLNASLLTMDGRLSITSGSGIDATALLNARNSTIQAKSDVAVRATGAAASLSLDNALFSAGGNLSLEAGAVGATSVFEASASSVEMKGDISVRANAAEARMSADADSRIFLGGDIRVEGGATAQAALDFDGTLTLTGMRDRAQPHTIAAIRGGGGALIDLAEIDTREHVWLTSDGVDNSFKVGHVRLSDDRDLRIFNALDDIEIGTLTVFGKGRVHVEDPMRSGVRGMTLDARSADLSIITQQSVGAYETTGLPVLAVDEADIRNARLSVDDAPYNGRIALTQDQHVRLIQAENDIRATTHYYRTKTSLQDRFSIDVRGKNVDLMLMSPSLKSYTEGAAAGLSIVGQGADFVLNRALDSAVKATFGAGERGAFFSEIGYNHYQYETGSYVKARGASFVAGLARGKDVDEGRVTVGVFFETGLGNYDTYNSFPRMPAVEGGGKATYYGPGALARYDAPSGFHADVAFRAGQSKLDFDTGDIQYTTVAQGLGKAHFSADAMYYSLIAGFGYPLKLSQTTTLDVSAHLLMTRRSANSTKVHFDKLKFDAANSFRGRVGARLTHARNEKTSFYAGIYWDEEYKGETKASLNGLEIHDAANLRGGTGIGEVGVVVKSAGVPNFSLDLNARGYAGQMKGAAANLRFKWLF